MEAAACDNIEAADVDETCLHIMLSMCVVSLVAAIVIILGLWTIPVQREKFVTIRTEKIIQSGRRVSDIIELTPTTCWRNVESANNSADCVFKGSFPAELAELSLWWNGLDWLREPESRLHCRKTVGFGRRYVYVRTWRYYSLR